MHFTTALLALLTTPLLTLAQTSSGANSFKIPDSGLSFTGGKATTLNWDPTTDGTVTLVLRSGSANDLNEGTTIASSIDNSGSFTWTPSNDLTRGSDYTIEIVSDEDPSEVNYTPLFVLDTPTTVAKSTSIVSLGMPSAAPELSTASPTGKATSLTGVETLASSATETGDGVIPVTPVTTGNSMQTMMTASASNSAATGSMATAASSGAASASNSDELASPAQTGNAAFRHSAAMGFVGAVAMGALAL